MKRKFLNQIITRRLLGLHQMGIVIIRNNYPQIEEDACLRTKYQENNRINLKH